MAKTPEEFLTGCTVKKFDPKPKLAVVVAADAPADRVEQAGNADDKQADADASKVAELAALSPMQYSRVRKDQAEALGVELKVLDHEVKKARGDADGALQGQALELPEIEPWDAPVTGAELLDAFAARIGRHVHARPEQIDAAALWALATHTGDIFDIAPRLGIRSAEPSSGKTTLLDVLECLVHRPLAGGGISSAAVARVVEAARPTLLIDEADTFLADNEDLRGVLNQGHRKGGQVLKLCGENYTPRRFSVFCYCAIALLGKSLPLTLEDRAVSIEMYRALSGEAPARIAKADRDAMAVLVRKARAFVRDHAARLRVLEPALPEWMSNRRADNWRGLIAIAETAGPQWRDRALTAAHFVCKAQDTTSFRTRLLSDIRDIFVKADQPQLPSDELVTSLADLEGRPWAEWSKGKPMTKNALAKVLDNFKIGPADIWHNARCVRGYRLKQFADAFARYLPPLEVRDCEEAQKQ